MERTGGLLGSDDQDSTFCVNDLFCNPPFSKPDDELKSIVEWIEVVIADPNGPMPIPSTSQAYLGPGAKSTGESAGPLLPLTAPMMMCSTSDLRHTNPDHSALMYSRSSEITGELNALNCIPSSERDVSLVTQTPREVISPPASRGTAHPKTRYSKNATASNYCHICGRKPSSGLGVCANTKVGLCRKVVCDKCLLLYERDNFKEAKDPQMQWKCTHCRGVCPLRARCKQYIRCSHRRRARKVEAASRNVQNCPLAPQAAEQNHQPTPSQVFLSPPPLPAPRALNQISLVASAKRKRQLTPTLRDEGSSKPQKPQRSAQTLPPLPNTPAVPYTAIRSTLENDRPFLGGPLVQSLLGSLARSSANHDPIHVAELIDDALATPLPATPHGRGQKRGRTQIISGPNTVGSSDNGEMAVMYGRSMDFDDPDLQQDTDGFRLDVLETREGKRRRVVGRKEVNEKLPADLFADIIYPVSVGDMMRPRSGGGDPFADPEE